MATDLEVAMTTSAGNMAGDATSTQPSHPHVLAPRCVCALRGAKGQDMRVKVQGEGLGEVFITPQGLVYAQT